MSKFEKTFAGGNPLKADEMNQMVDAIEGKAELTIKPEQALRVMKVMEAAFESDEKSEAIKTNI